MFEKLKNERSLIELRRGKTLELVARGIRQTDIAKRLNVSEATVSLDLQYLSCQASENIKTHIEERIPMSYQKCESGLNQVLQKLWEMSESTDDVKEKTQCYSIISNTYRYLKELSTDEATINKALEFIDKQSKVKEKVKENEEQEEEVRAEDTNEEEQGEAEEVSS